MRAPTVNVFRKCKAQHKYLSVSSVLACSDLLILSVEKAASVRCPEPAERAKENNVYQALPSAVKQRVDVSPVSITRD